MSFRKVDKDASVTLSQGETKDSNLYWDVKESQETGSYTMRVETDDDIKEFPVDVIPSSGISRWTFDTADISGSTAVDSWGSNDGTISGATTGVAGELNEAYSFDGTDDYVSIPNIGLSSASSFSLSAWVNLDGTGSNQTLMGRYDGSDDILSIYWDGSGWECRIGHVGGSEQQFKGGSANAGSWTHIAVTFDSSGPTTTIYQDGSSVASSSNSLADFADSTTGPHIGRRSDGSGLLGGDIDDPRIYDKALSSSEVSNLYNNGSIS